jgi:cytochrome c biogenesis protein CcdA
MYKPMDKRIKFVVLAVLTFIVIGYSYYPLAAPLKNDLTIQTIFGALGGIFILVLLIERVTEIAIAILREALAERIKGELAALQSDPLRAGVTEAEANAKLIAYQAETKVIALLIGFSLSIIVCSAGIGILNTIVVIDSTMGNLRFLRGIDITLTSGLLAGGSDSFHQFISALENFFESTKSKT